MVSLVTCFVLHGGEIIGNIIVRPNHQVGHFCHAVSFGIHGVDAPVFVAPELSASKHHFSLLFRRKLIKNLVEHSVSVGNILVIWVDLVSQVQYAVDALDSSQHVLPWILLSQ